MSDMYITMMSVIIAGILNMIFVKTSEFYKNNKTPINEKMFGKNKTWTGFISMIVFSIISQVLWGAICNELGITQRSELYVNYENEMIYNIIVGAAFGFMYMLFELPNSFIKRRFDIPEGKTVKGLKGSVFFVIDQTDSMLGVMLVLVLISNIGLHKYIMYTMLGAVTHIAVNTVLYTLKIRKNL